MIMFAKMFVVIKDIFLTMPDVVILFKECYTINILIIFAVMFMNQKRKSRQEQIYEFIYQFNYPILTHEVPTFDQSITN